MDQLVKRLEQKFANVHFVIGSDFYWSPSSREIFYSVSASQISDKWALLHETAHAILNHTDYQSDVQLLRLEVEAWTQAKELASTFGIFISEEHIQDCLDTYREWLYARSTCPNCGMKGIQASHSKTYRCFICHRRWRVTKSRFCRPYRIASPSDVSSDFTQ